MAPINFLGNICLKYDSFYGGYPRGSSLSAAFSNRVFGYKSGDSMMRNGVTNTELKMNFNSGEFLSEIEVVLRIPKDEELYNMEAGLSTIQGKHILFSISYPKGGFKGSDINTVFNQSTKSAGTMGDAWIIDRSKLRAKINITDSDIEALIKQDKVSISYAHWYDESLPTSSPFYFDHLLIYPRKGGL